MAEQKKAAVDAALRDMFRALETRALPDRIRSVVDQLDEGEPLVTAPRKQRER